VAIHQQDPLTLLGLNFTRIAFGADFPPEVLLLSRIKARAVDDLGRVESCACLVTLKRSTRYSQ